MAKRNLWLGGAVPMEPGERDRIVRVQQLTDGVGDAGEPKEAWTTLFDTYWVRKDDMRGDERFKAGQEVAAQLVRWEGPWHESLDPDVVDVPKKRRFVYRDRVHDIVDCMEIGRRDGLEFTTLVNMTVTA